MNTVVEDINGIAYLVKNGIESPENSNNAILSVQNAILSGLGKTASGAKIFNNAILSGLGCDAILSGQFHFHDAIYVFRYCIKGMPYGGSLRTPLKG